MQSFRVMLPSIALVAVVVLGCDTTDPVSESNVAPPPPVVPTPPPVPLVLSVNPGSRRATAQPNTPAPTDNATVTLTGDNAAATVWTASHKQSWNTIMAGTGTGSGTISWMRNTAGLGVGLYVDTITICSTGATGSPATIIDTLQIVAAPVPLTVAVTPLTRSTSVMQGGTAAGDNVAIGITGDGAANAAWSVSSHAAWASLTTATGSGSGSASWTRNAAGLATGVYVDTLVVTVPGAVGSPVTVLDSLVVTPPLTMQLSPLSGHASVVQGGSAPSGSFGVNFSGTGAATAPWGAGHRKAWTTLTIAAGTGSGTVSWNRSATGLAIGTYVDTIAVLAPGALGSPTAYIDSLIVTAPPVPLTLTLSAHSFRTNITAGGAGGSGSVNITLAGDNAATAAWTATRLQGWNTLTTSSGTGNGTVAWTRATTGLAAGTYVDSITVAVPGALNAPQFIVDSVVVTAAPGNGGGSGGTGGTADLGVDANLHAKQIFPASNLWNQPVDTAQVDPLSDLIIGQFGVYTRLHPDFGADWGGGPFGIPYVVVPDNTPRSTVTFDYDGESDHVGYPIPPNPPIEPSGDGHILMVTQGEWKLYELFAASKDANGNWHAGSGAVWDLTNGTTRPAGWTSADAAGLPILPGLVRYDEVYIKGEIDHALRFTVAGTRGAYLPPANHITNYSTDPARPPMGMRIRLKASYDISGFPPAAQVILRALKKYGMIVADNGSTMFLSGVADSRWNDDVNNTLKAVFAGDFEVVKMTGLVTP